MAELRTGTAGWVFAPWRGTFYPKGVTQKNELNYASRKLTSIEINSTFKYNQKPSSFAKWAGQTPDGFVFSVKGPEQVTHRKRLKNCRQDVANFLASGPLALGDRLGPIIWQLPPNLIFDRESFAAFAALLPRDAQGYLELASEADKERGETFLDIGGIGKIRHAIEMRHPSFQNEDAISILRDHNIAAVIADTPKQPERLLTANFAYCRLQGPARAEATGYEEANMDSLASDMLEWAQKGNDVYAYFVHEDKLHAPHNAMTLASKLGITPYGDPND